MKNFGEILALLCAILLTTVSMAYNAATLIETYDAIAIIFIGAIEFIIWGFAFITCMLWVRYILDIARIINNKRDAEKSQPETQ
ncbi:MAG: hypothetical protein PHV83_05335 [Bacteroidales bacterium]|nr:hypothetical protein [Bacteroidales bacterium]